MTESGLPTSSLNRSNPPMTRTDASSIAADGGFGPMKGKAVEAGSDQSEADADAIADDEFEEGVGDDFDDFEAGAIDDDFGDFDEEFQQPPSPTKPDPERASSDAVHVSYTSPFVSRFIIKLMSLYHLCPHNSCSKTRLMLNHDKATS